MPAKNLVETVVSRCGKTARQLNEETRSVQLRVTRQGGVRLFFAISSKGGGVTEVYVDVGADDFASVVAAMAEGSRSKAMTVMASELAKQVSEQSQYDAKTRGQERHSLVALAREKVRAAPADNRDLAELVCRQIGRLADERGNTGNAPGDSAA